MEKLKELISRAVLVAAWRDGDIDTNDGTYATTDTDEMIYLESAIQELFNGMEAYDLICTKRLSDYIDCAIDSEIKQINNHDRLTEENAKLRKMLKMCADKLDKEVGFTGVANAAHFLLDELKDKNNDK